jgi:hypothetical protein
MLGAFAVTLMAGALGLMPLAERRPVVLTTDIGTEVDDQWALAHLALSADLDLKGIVTTHAPNLAAPAAETSANYSRASPGRRFLPARASRWPRLTSRWPTPASTS